jgi:hypothetical protein
MLALTVLGGLAEFERANKGPRQRNAASELRRGRLLRSQAQLTRHQRVCGVIILGRLRLVSLLDEGEAC